MQLDIVTKDGELCDKLSAETTPEMSNHPVLDRFHISSDSVARDFTTITKTQESQ